MIARDQIVLPFSVDVPDTVKMRIIVVIDLANDAAQVLFCPFGDLGPKSDHPTVHG